MNKRIIDVCASAYNFSSLYAQFSLNSSPLKTSSPVTSGKVITFKIEDLCPIIFVYSDETEKLVY